MVGRGRRPCNEKFVLHKPLGYKTSGWGKQMPNSWISQIASGFSAHTLVTLSLIFHTKSHSPCLPSLLWNAVKFCSSPACRFLTQSLACSVTSDSGITLASLDCSLVTSLHDLFFRLNNYSSVSHSPDMSSLMLIPLQLHDDVTLAIYNLQGNLELANNDWFG